LIALWSICYPVKKKHPRKRHSEYSVSHADPLFRRGTKNSRLYHLVERLFFVSFGQTCLLRFVSLLSIHGFPHKLFRTKLSLYHRFCLRESHSLVRLWYGRACETLTHAQRTQLPTPDHVTAHAHATTPTWTRPSQIHFQSVLCV
jgi:hypothetical protein